MNKEQRRYLLKFGMIAVVVLVGAISFHAERFWGWPFLILALVVGLIGGAGAVFMWDRLKSVWSGFSKKRKALLIGAVVAVILVASYIANYGKSDATSNLLIDLACIILALLLWGSFRLFSRFLDAIWARLHNR